jgi:hypothetical protein
MADAIYNKVAEFMTDSVVFTPKALLINTTNLLLVPQYKCHRNWSLDL